MENSREEVKRFMAERGWSDQPPADLAKSIVIEAAELLEHFQWENFFGEEVVKDPRIKKEIVKELANAGDIQRGQTQEWVDNLVDRSRKTTEQVLELVRHEVSVQLSKVDNSTIENLANQVADILKRSADAGRAATSGASAQAAKSAKAAKKTAADTAKGAKSTATKGAKAARSTAAKGAKVAKQTAKDTTATAKSTATKGAKAARQATERVTPSSRKKSASAPKATTKAKPAAKKAPAKKAPAKKAAVKKASPAAKATSAAPKSAPTKGTSN